MKNKADQAHNVVHVVRHAYRGKYTTHSLYRNNAPFLVPNIDECVLSRRQAYTLAEMFNGTIPWPRRKAA
ncbi:MAG TPA: hypothetical protein VK681_39240 [Reyranella sp.]|nr:hypothetical protein [Reyranella sp.]